MKKLRNEPKRTLAVLRAAAIRTVRAEILRLDLASDEFTAEQALLVLDDLYRTDKVLLASIWYGKAHDHQIKLFKREWKARS